MIVYAPVGPTQKEPWCCDGWGTGKQIEGCGKLWAERRDVFPGEMPCEHY